jgi:hypothetical protein
VIAPATAALRDAAVSAMPADLAALLMGAGDAIALVDACDTAACDPRALTGCWLDALCALDAAACYDVRESGALPTWWDAGYDDAAHRHARALLAAEVAA